MNDFLTEIYFFLCYFSEYSQYWDFFVFFIPIVLFIELPLYVLILISIIKVFQVTIFAKPGTISFYPSVSCVITCYNEGESITRTVKSLIHQLYDGFIEVIVVIDGADDINKPTLNAALKFAKTYNIPEKRKVIIIPKKKRGGHASSENLGIRLATSKFVVILDGDCSCDNDMIHLAVRNFIDENVVGISGNIRVRNARENLLTNCQTIEYITGLQLSRIGLSKLGILNNISGAFGVFRKDFIKKIGGWKNGTAEDLDLVIRIKSYFKRYPQLKIIHEHRSIVHTDVPNTFKGLLKQRMRWEGDLFYIFFRRHLYSLLPRYMGWKNFLGVLWYGIFFCVLVPILVMLYFIYMLFFYNITYFLVVLLVTYFYYLLVLCFLYFLYLLLVSERKLYDLSFIYLLPIMPIYQFIGRLWTAVSIIFEIFLLTHKDTGMAPWWVIRKTH